MPVVEPNFKIGLCAVCNKSPADKFCDYIMEYTNDTIFLRNRFEFNEVNRRGAQYVTCDLPLCEKCSKEIAIDHDLCPHHYGLYTKRELPSKFQRKRRTQIRGYVAGIELKN